MNLFEGRELGWIREFEPAASQVFAWRCVVCRCATTAAHKWILKSGTKRRTLKKIEWIKSFHSASLIQSKLQEHRFEANQMKKKMKELRGEKSFFAKKPFFAFELNPSYVSKQRWELCIAEAETYRGVFFSGFLIRLALDYYISLSQFLKCQRLCCGLESPEKVSNSILIWKHRKGPNVQPWCAQHWEMMLNC